MSEKATSSAEKWWTRRKHVEWVTSDMLPSLILLSAHAGDRRQWIVNTQSTDHLSLQNREELEIVHLVIASFDLSLPHLNRQESLTLNWETNSPTWFDASRVKKESKTSDLIQFSVDIMNPKSVSRQRIVLLYLLWESRQQYESVSRFHRDRMVETKIVSISIASFVWTRWTCTIHTGKDTEEDTLLGFHFQIC